MASRYEDGLHPVAHFEPLNTEYSTLPQVYQPMERSDSPAPQAYKAEKGPETAPVPVDSEHQALPAYDGKDSTYTEAGRNATTPSPPSKRILGLPRRTALLASAIGLIVILALALGLGIGLGVRNHGTTRDVAGSSSSTDAGAASTSSTSSVVATTTSGPTQTSSQTSSSTTSTISAVATSGFTGVAEVKCPGINNTVETSGSSRFQVLCATHWITGQAAANNNGTVQAVGNNKLVAYSLQECLDYCVEYNNELNSTVNPDQNGSGCLAVTYNANLTSAFANFEQNCFLKDREGVWKSAQGTTESALLISV